MAQPTFAPSHTMPVMFPAMFLMAAQMASYPPPCRYTMPQDDPVDATTQPHRALSLPR